MNKNRKNTKNRLRRGKKIEAKKPLFSANEHINIGNTDGPIKGESIDLRIPNSINVD